MQRRIESGVVVLIGVGLIAVALFAQLFTRAPAFEELTDDFRPLMTDKAISTMHSDLEGMQAMTTEIQTKMLPDMAAALGMPPADFNSFAAESFPATTRGLEQLPGITEQFVGMGHALSLQQENFEAADAIPTASMPVTVFPWGLALVGAVAIIVGIVMFRTVHIGSYIALAMGLLMIGGALFMSWPSKTSKADDLNLALRDMMTVQQVEGAQGALAVVGDMGAEMQTQMLPALAGQMGMTEPEMMSYISDSYPSVGAMLTNFEGVQGRFNVMVTAMGANIDNYNEIKPLSMEPINWLFVAAGILIAISGGMALLVHAPITRRHPAVHAH